jgi:preprotein translocase SecF subunit
MKNKNRSIFAAIILIVAVGVYLSSFGLNLGRYIISPVKDEMDLGLDLSGGVYVVLEAVTDATGVELDEKISQAKSIIEQRVNGLGVSEPNITVENNNRIRIELAGLTNPQEAIDLIGKTAQLQFRELDGTIVLTGENVKESQVTYGDKNEVVVALEFDKAGAEAFAEATGRLMAEPNREDRIIEIVLDGDIISAPYVSDEITDGKGVISGGFTIEEATNLANLIRAGALPVEMEEIEVSVVGPTLGLESLDKSIYAAIIGLILIFIFMIFMYKLPGLAADIALTIYIMVVLGVLIAINAKLTLAGIAGLILSVGMAVDANVVIFERIKEEILLGKSVRTAVDSGFKRAMKTIIDANVTTLIAGLVLFYFGTGTVKGFAVTLLVGLAVSLLTAVFATRYLLKIIVKMELSKENKMYGVRKQSNEVSMKLNVVKNKRNYFMVSLSIIAVGLVMVFARGLNVGIDFTGGTLIQIELENEVPVDEIRNITDSFDKNASIVHAGENNTQIIIKTTVNLDNEERFEVFTQFKDKYGLTDDDFVKQLKFGPTIGKETQKKAVISVLIASLCMLAYITLRFEFLFGVAAVIALLHDVLIGIAVYSIFKVPVNSSFIAAMLTIVGYSINDTIVVFDRIRENIKKMRKSKYEEIVELSISQTLVRSINTSVTTLFAISALYIFGVEAIRDFAFPLIVGVLAGTYSSIFIASPIWVMLKSLKGDVNYYNPNKVQN